jgi:hypothetical protein
MLPISPHAMSDRKSPYSFSVSTTEKSRGRRQIFASSASNSSTRCSTSGNSAATSRTIASKKPSVARWIVCFDDDVTDRPCARANPNAKRAASVHGRRSMMRSETATSGPMRCPGSS